MMKPDRVVAAAGPASRAASSWALLNGCRETGKRFRLSWSAIPARVKIRFFATIAIGLFLCAGVTTLLTLVARRQAPLGLAAWDERMLRRIADQGPLSVQNAILLESFGNLAYLIPLVLTCAVIAARHRKAMTALAFVLSYALARPLVLLGWSLWDRSRPRIILDGQAVPPLHSYPSGHVILALSAYGLLAYLWVRASDSWIERAIAVALTLSLVSVTALARVRLGTHWPSDVLAGFVIGLAWLAVMVYALHRAETHDAPGNT